jgi:hypothetical protein
MPDPNNPKAQLDFFVLIVKYIFISNINRELWIKLRKLFIGIFINRDGRLP